MTQQEAFNMAGAAHDELADDQDLLIFSGRQIDAQKSKNGRVLVEVPLGADVAQHQATMERPEPLDAQRAVRGVWGLWRDRVLVPVSESGEDAMVPSPSRSEAFLKRQVQPGPMAGRAQDGDEVAVVSGRAPEEANISGANRNAAGWSVSRDRMVVDPFRLSTPAVDGGDAAVQAVAPSNLPLDGDAGGARRLDLRLAKGFSESEGFEAKQRHGMQPKSSREQPITMIVPGSPSEEMVPDDGSSPLLQKNIGSGSAAPEAASDYNARQIGHIVTAGETLPRAAGAHALPRDVTPPSPAQQIALAVQGSDLRGVELRLQPEELGTVRILLQYDGDHLRVLVQAERGDTLDLLRRSSSELQQALHTAGHSSTSFSFQRPDAEGQAPAARPSANERIEPEPEQIVVAPRNVAQGRLDLRL